MQKILQAAVTIFKFIQMNYHSPWNLQSRQLPPTQEYHILVQLFWCYTKEPSSAIIRTAGRRHAIRGTRWSNLPYRWAGLGHQDTPNRNLGRQNHTTKRLFIILRIRSAYESLKYLSDELNSTGNKFRAKSRIAGHLRILSGELRIVPASQSNERLQSGIAIFEPNKCRVASVVNICPAIENLHHIGCLVQDREGVDQVSALERIKLIHPIFTSAAIALKKTTKKVIFKFKICNSSNG